jgi:F-type H+-transporting ATPase subunit b
MENLIDQFSSGLFFIQSLIFIVLILLLKKFAWKPILESINEREVSIQDALNQAQLAKKEMESLQAENQHIIREAKAERDSILKEAREIKDQIVTEAKTVAQEEGSKMIEQARQSIQAEKVAAMADIKLQMGDLSVNIAEAILRDKLNSTEAQNALVQNLLNNTNFN